jgi:vanillate/4-hydroxybenzoate decarboxylase subunit D
MPPFPRPQEATVSLVKEPVDGSCPECGAAQLRRYPVNSEGGWFQVVKCQNCLHSVSRERWHLLGSLQLLSDTI